MCHGSGIKMLSCKRLKGFNEWNAFFFFSRPAHYHRSTCGFTTSFQSGSVNIIMLVKQVTQKYWTFHFAPHLGVVAAFWAAVLLVRPNQHKILCQLISQQH